MPSKYKIIDGMKCEAKLLTLAEKLARDAPLGIKGARSIWEAALDGNKVTQPERCAIEHIMENSPHGLTSEAKTFLQYWLEEETVSNLRGATCVVVDEVRCDEAMIKVADHFRGHKCPLGIRAAEAIWFSALDGWGVTNIERATIDFILHKYKFDDPGRSFLESKQSWLTMQADALTAGSEGDHADGAALGATDPNALVFRFQDAIGLELSVFDPNSRHQADFRPGSRIRFHGLTHAALNDLQGTCEKFDDTTQRWVVRLSNGDIKAVKPNNLQIDVPSSSRLRVIFDKCDINKNGCINKIGLIKSLRQDAEIAKFFQLPTNIRQEDGSRDELEELFQEIDKDGDREIRWMDLLAWSGGRRLDTPAR